MLTAIMRTSFIIFFNLLIFLLYGQYDTINQFDGNGKKHGYWIKYLDSNLNPTDSSHSYFYGLEYYDSGKGVIKFDKHWFHRKYRHSFIDNTMTKGRPRVLDGTYTWFDDSDSLADCIETFKQGRPVRFVGYRQQCNHFPRGVDEYIDFTRTYNNLVGSFYIEVGDKKYWFRKIDKKWTMAKIN